MCDPISLGSLAVGAAGNAISGYERSQSAAAEINARNAATQAELERSRKYGQQTQASFDKSVDIYNPGAQAQGLASSQSQIGDVLTTKTNGGSISGASATARGTGPIRHGGG